MFLDSWAEPGFHRFWRVWNPAYGYLLFRLYRRMGGSRRGPLPALVVFSACGFVAHDLPVGILFGRPIIVCTIAFLVWGLFASISRTFESRLTGWPPFLRALCNLSLLFIGMACGVLAQRTFLA